jgi:hypothetical protein
MSPKNNIVPDGPLTKFIAVPGTSKEGKLLINFLLLIDYTKFLPLHFN